MPDNYIEIKNFTKFIGNDKILDNISLNIERQTIVGFIGKNGSGKTMLFRAIAGLINPTEGEILIDGKQLGKDISFPPSLGLIIENIGLWNHLNGFECLKLLAEIKGEIGDKEILNTLERVGLNPDEKKKTGKYSLGMKQRLVIAQAIMEHPKLLILDEPTNALDPEGIELLNQILLEERENGATILLASHDKEEIDRLCDITYTLHSGKLCDNE